MTGGCDLFARRCIVPATSFRELGPDKTPEWFVPRYDLPLIAFAGLWTLARSANKGERQVFGVLMTDANAVVAPIHRNATPVILTTWLMSTNGSK